MEEVLGLRRLYSKLTLTTAEDTNVHKMDGFFVKTDAYPYEYVGVEAKTSIQPTGKARFSGHRFGIYKQMIQSLDGYGLADKRFDFVSIRDNLERGSFTDQEAARIKGDLVPPGPEKLKFIGMAVVNSSSCQAPDYDYVLTASCKQQFEFEALVVTNLSSLAMQAYKDMRKVLGGGK